MGWAAGRKLRKAVDGLSRVLAIELLTSTRALDFRAAEEGAEKHAPSPVTAAVHELFRTRIDAPDTDSFLSPTITAAHEFVASGEVRAAVERVLGFDLA